MKASVGTVSEVSSGFGLAIRSTIPLPGAMPFADPATACSDVIEIAYGSTPSWQALRCWEVYRVASADLFEIMVPGLACFTFLDRRRILVDPVPGADEGHIAELLAATILPALLWARGDVVLHASAFVLPEATHGIALVGASGSGKSSAVARALEMGGRVVADDSLRIIVRKGALIGVGLAGGYFERTGQASRSFRTIPPRRRQSSSALAAFAVITPGAPTLRRIVGTEALGALLRHRHRPRIATLLGSEAALLPLLAEFANAIPVFAVPGSGVSTVHDACVKLGSTEREDSDGDVEA